MPLSTKRLIPFILLLAALALGPAKLSQAETAPAEAQAAVVSVIQAQLEAFGRDDAQGAFAFAAPNIQQKFVNPEIFMEMVKTGYSPVYRPLAVEFLDSRVISGVTFQAVRLINGEGHAVIALYRMEQQADGSWRVAGVQLVEPDDGLS